MIRVANSSTIAAYSYDQKRNALKVEYMKTGWYEYYNISQEEYNMMSINTSPGKAIKYLVKGKEYRKI